MQNVYEEATTPRTICFWWPYPSDGIRKIKKRNAQ